MAPLPLDIIADILSRLPVKTLVRFKSVCKLWKSLLTCPNFAKIHLKQTLSSGTHSRLVIAYDSLSFSSETQTQTQTHLDFSQLNHHPAVRILGSCNGLLCISNYPKTTVFIFNPFTKTHHLIPTFSPPPTANFKDPSFRNIVDFGFGYDPLLDDYMVLRMTQTRRNGKCVYREACVYSLRNDSWKCVKDETTCEMMMGNGGTLVNDTLHFIHYVRGPTKHNSLIKCFNLKDETFSTLELPKYDDDGDDDESSDIRLGLGEFRGCLCVMVNYYASNKGSCRRELARSELWVMKEHGNKDSWVKLFSIDEPGVIGANYYIRTVGYSKDGRRVLLELDGMLFGWYDLEKNEFKRIPAGGVPSPDQRFTTWPFVESLVSREVDKAEAKETAMPEKKKRKINPAMDDAGEFKLRLSDQTKDATCQCSTRDDILLSNNSQGASDLCNRFSSIVDLMWHSTEFLGLPSCERLPEGSGTLVEEAMKRVNGLKVGLIDSSQNSKASSDYHESFIRTPITRPTHRCQDDITLSKHGRACACILCGKPHKVNFYGVCEGWIRGVVPSAQLYAYPVGCEKTPTCEKTIEMMCEAFDKAIVDRVKVISMSQGDRARTPSRMQGDILGKKILEAFKEGIVTCVGVGNDGPVEASALTALPWAVNVASCTSTKVSLTKIELLIDGSVPVPQDVDILGTVQKGDGVAHILDVFQGMSMNIMESSVRPLRFGSSSEGQETILYWNKGTDTINMIKATKNYKSRILNGAICGYPIAAITREDSDKLWQWREKFPALLHVKIHTSEFHDDPRGVFVPDFSGRGPSYLYDDVLTPDLVAPGYAILTSHPTDIPICKQDSSAEMIYGDQFTVTGTSSSTPLVAGIVLLLIAYHADWHPSVIKSALITTAWSLVARLVPGNAFASGSGLINVEGALDPGLAYEEIATNFEQYLEGQLSVFRLNLPTFAASFPHSYKVRERIFHRELLNVGEGSATYKCEIEFFDKSLDNDVEITVEPATLSFEPKQRKQFRMKVKLCPRPRGYVSALLKWVPQTPGRREVTSPIILYHRSPFDEPVWYGTWEESTEAKLQKKRKRQQHGP